MAIREFANNMTSGSFSVAGGTAFGMVAPTGIIDGDLIVLLGAASDGIGGFSSPGFTQDFNVTESGTTDSGLWIAHKIALGEPISWPITSTGTETGVWAVVAFRNVNKAAPLGQTACTSLTQVGETPAITVSATDSWLLSVLVSDAPAPGCVWTGGSFIKANPIDPQLFVSMMVGYEDLLGRTGTFVRSASPSLADVGVGALLEIQAAPGGGPFNAFE